MLLSGRKEMLSIWSVGFCVGVPFSKASRCLYYITTMETCVSSFSSRTLRSHHQHIQAEEEEELHHHEDDRSLLDVNVDAGHCFYSISSLQENITLWQGNQKLFSIHLIDDAVFFFWQHFFKNRNVNDSRRVVTIFLVSITKN